ncbi:hypothetical protein L0337_05745 [candidate division KSB1 bacterium]|nr:hypothetical protein [candidate division KSB1 bacterium]
MDINSKPCLRRRLLPLIEIGRQWLLFEMNGWDIFMAFTFQKNLNPQTKINIFAEIVKMIHSLRVMPSATGGEDVIQ